MRIHGLQKLTLLDYPGKVACTIFTAGCNFRCPFCHNAGLVTRINEEQQIPEEEVLAYLQKRKGVLDGVCVSGGEPLLQSDIKEFLKKLKELDYEVKLDTNGSYPQLLAELIEEKLIDYVAMDIKNTLAKYGLTIGMEGYDTSLIEQSVELLKTGAIPYEFRTTVVREFHRQEDCAVIGKWLSGDSMYFLQKFEDSGDLIERKVRGYDDAVMKQALETVRKYLPAAKLRGVE